MLSLKYITDNFEKVKLSSAAKNEDVDLEKIIKLDIKRKKIISEVEILKAKRNQLNKNISKNSPLTFDDIS